MRTHPDELHIHDVEAYNTIFKVGSLFEKDKRFYGFPFEGSHFNMTTLKAAKPRRDMFQPYLSKGAIDSVQGLLEKSIWRFIDILQEHVSEHKIVDLTLGYRCVTSDMMLAYSFEKPLFALADTNFEFPLAVRLSALLKGGFLSQHFRRTTTLLLKVVTRLPHGVLSALGLGPIVDIQKLSV